MDPNERLLWRVLQDRSSDGRSLGLRSGWLLFGALALAVIALPLSRMISSGNSGRPGSLAAAVSDLDIPAASAAVTRVSSQMTPVAPALTPEATASVRAARYVVQSGDNLQSIATRNSLRPATLASINELDQPDLLKPGLTLLIPPTDGVVHVVEAGETLNAIAARDGGDVGRIISSNEPDDPDHIPVGLRLFIPTNTGQSD